MTESQAQAQQNLNDCGCCDGLTVETPVGVVNRPGLSAIAYRAGTHSQFKSSMIARLSGSGLPELRELKTRADDDFTIALLDAWAVVCDVLTFYQERIANESYLLTATERGSIINLARLIGYELQPGVAASTYLAFALETGIGSPSEVSVEIGVKVQSIPGPGEKPQTFETIEQITAMGEWNEMKPRLTKLLFPDLDSQEVYLEGVTTNLKPGDILLFVGLERLKDENRNRWDFRRITSVEPDPDNKRTLVQWRDQLTRVVASNTTPQTEVKVYAMRLRASIFGYNAPEWKTLPLALRVGEVAPVGSPNPPNTPFLPGAFFDRKNTWADAGLPPATTSINLDSVYSQVIVNSWIVLVKPETGSGTTPFSELCRVKDVAEEAKADFNISAKTTRVGISGENENIHSFSPRDTAVAAQSEELPLAETPIADPVWQDEIELNELITPLAEGRNIVLTGQRMRVRIGVMSSQLTLVSLSNPEVFKTLATGDELIMLTLPVNLTPGSTTMRYELEDKGGFVGYTNAPEAEVTRITADEGDPFVSEVATIDSTELADDTHSKLVLTAPLNNVFDRATVTINANVALGTHGETVANEVLGSGIASQPYQRFALSQSPLTFTSADTPSGGETSLEVRVNDLKWKEVRTLFGHGPRERIYMTHANEDQQTTVQFGDGVTGARLPMGHENVHATYRKGIGVEGLVKANQLSLLMTRPLGVKSVINPFPATGAQDPQSLGDARANSPITVLTLDRIVSLRDYEDFARSFSGIAKALATWTWNIHARGIFLTVAGIDGAEVDTSLRDTLISAIYKFSDAHVPLTIKSYRPVTFKLGADVKVDPDYIEAKVLTAIEAALQSGFSFESRAFGQAVTLSEVVSAIQNVAGVVAVDVNKLYRSDEPEALHSLLAAAAPQPGENASEPAAELLTLDEAPLELGVML